MSRMKKLRGFRGRGRHSSQTADRGESILLSSDYIENRDALGTIYADCADVIIHEFRVGETVPAAVIYVCDLSNVEQIDDQVIGTLAQPAFDTASIIDMQSVRMRIPISSTQEIYDFNELIGQVSQGNPVLILDGCNSALSLRLALWDKRSIDEPIAESVVRGPREGFTETLGTNLSMIRRRIRSPMLKVKKMDLGRYTKTTVAILYVEGLVVKGLLEEVEQRISRIDIDGILESGNIEELIEDNPYSPFPQLLSTERPDTCASALLEGRVVMVTNGTPFALIAPITMFSLLQSPEDYFQRYWMGTVIRFLRYLFVAIALLVPSLYVAILTYHQEIYRRSCF